MFIGVTPHLRPPQVGAGVREQLLRDGRVLFEIQPRPVNFAQRQVERRGFCANSSPVAAPISGNTFSGERRM